MIGPYGYFNSAVLGQGEDHRFGIAQFEMRFVGKPEPAPAPVPFELQGFGGAEFGDVGKVFAGEEALVFGDDPEFLARQFFVDGGDEFNLAAA